VASNNFWVIREDHRLETLSVQFPLAQKLVDEERRPWNSLMAAGRRQQYISAAKRADSRSSTSMRFELTTRFVSRRGLS